MSERDTENESHDRELDHDDAPTEDYDPRRVAHAKYDPRSRGTYSHGKDQEPRRPAELNVPVLAPASRAAPSYARSSELRSPDCSPLAPTGIGRDSTQELRPGTIVGSDFEIMRPLSKGGMGVVYVARQRSTNVERALKLMLPAIALNEELRARFTREASIGSSIHSDHIVQVVRAGIDHALSSPWLAMELLRGLDLGAFLERNGPPRPEIAFGILQQLAAGLGAAHDVGIVHRDLKPENVFIADTGRHDAPFTVKILDFGIAKLVLDAGAAGSMAIGSPLWMAPEQTEVGLTIGAGTDVWAFGLLAFFVLTGRAFWRTAALPHPSTFALISEICFEPIPSASSRAGWLGCSHALPPGFDEWLGCCLNREITRRFPDARTAWASLASVLARVPVSSSVALGATHLAPLAREIAPAAHPSVDPGRRRGRIMLALLAGTIGLGGGAALLSDWVAGRHSTTTHSAPSASASSISPPTDDKSAALRLYDNEYEDDHIQRALEIAGRLCASGDQDGCAIMGDAERRGLAVPKDAARAFKRLAAACDAKSMLACAYLGAAHGSGDGVPRDAAAALTLYRTACDANIPVACGLLGAAHEFGRGTAKDLGLALERYGKACDAGYHPGCVSLGHLYGNGRGVPRNHARAVELFDKGCNGGHANGCVNLGWYLENGKGAPRDEQRAAHLYTKACERGNALACNNLGALYIEGTVFPKDLAYGAKLYQQSCDKGELLACANLGYRHRYGEGVPKDTARALELFQRACDGGNGKGCTELGLLYRGGIGVKKDETQAGVLFERACDASYAFGCSKLGQFYEQRASKDRARATRMYADARALYQQACEGDSMDGCTNLGVLYGDGRGVARDEVQARELFTRACHRKVYRACGHLGELHEKPRQLVPDRASAIGHYRSACSGGFAPACENQKRLESK